MLAVNMPYDLYWNGELRAIDLYLNSIKYRDMLENKIAHLQGIYILKALQEVLQFQNPKEIFPRKPLDISGEKKEQDTQESIENDIRAMFAKIRKGERDG